MTSYSRSDRLQLALVAGAVAALGTLAHADWTCWRGPEQNGISREKIGTPSLAKIWSAKVGTGFSSVSVANGRAYTMGNDGRNDIVWCLSERTGKVLWKDSYPCKPGNYKGPRATPTVSGGVVYCVSRAGDVGAWDAASGKRKWLSNVARAVGAKVPGWGIAGSPVVSGNLLLVNIGTAGVGLNKATGAVVWKTGTQGSGYATPVLAKIGGKTVALMFAAKALAGVDPATGKVLLVYPWQTKYDVNAADPIPSGNSIFISSGYNHGAALLSVNGPRPSKVWESKVMRNHFNSCVLVDGYLYGNDQGTLKCVSLRTGAEKWSKPGSIGGGGLMVAGDKLIVMGERGDLFVASVSPTGYKEVAKAKPLTGATKCWTHPVVANGQIYCRDNGGNLVVLSAK